MPFFTMNEDNDDKKNAEGGEPAFIQQKLLSSRSIVISGEINQELAQKVVTQLILLQSISDEPIRIYLNSQGGHVEAGDTIHDFIKFIRPDVHIIGTGWVASAGITIFLAAKKEHRYSLPNTRFSLQAAAAVLQSASLIQRRGSHASLTIFSPGAGLVR